MMVVQLQLAAGARLVFAEYARYGERRVRRRGRLDRGGRFAAAAARRGRGGHVCSRRTTAVAARRRVVVVVVVVVAGHVDARRQLGHGAAVTGRPGCGVCAGQNALRYGSGPGTAHDKRERMKRIKKKKITIYIVYRIR